MSKDVPDPAAPNDVLGAWPAPKHIQDEVRDAEWADFGRMVAKNIFNTDDFSYALTHGALKAKDTKQLLGFVRAYILTGARP